MAEQRVIISGGDYPLEALYQPGCGRDLAIICHPHPLYGGNMHNNVVSALQKVFQDLGFATVRFNFRGVGGSKGEYSGGDGETRDLIGVWKDYGSKTRGLNCLAGYSFGAWIALKACQGGCSPDIMVLVSPPIGFLDFSDLNVPEIPVLILFGGSDEFCRLELVKGWLEDQPVRKDRIRMVTIDDCDHFYWGREDLLGKHVEGFIETFLKKS